MELLAVIERTPAERETVAWRKLLKENGLRKGPESADPSYEKFLWDCQWDRSKGSWTAIRPRENATGKTEAARAATH